MLNNLITLEKWSVDLLPVLDCLYGYSHKYSGYLPFKEITDIVRIGKTSRIGVKGIDVDDGKLYIQLSLKDQKAIQNKNWLDLDKYGLSDMKIIPYIKIERWDKVKLNIKNEEINELKVEGIVELYNNFEIDLDTEFIFLGHLKENVSKVLIQNSKSKAIYLIFKDKIKKI